MMSESVVEGSKLWCPNSTPANRNKWRTEESIKNETIQSFPTHGCRPPCCNSLFCLNSVHFDTNIDSTSKWEQHAEPIHWYLVLNDADQIISWPFVDALMNCMHRRCLTCVTSRLCIFACWRVYALYLIHHSLVHTSYTSVFMWKAFCTASFAQLFKYSILDFALFSFL